jgi:hypothetical protein
MSNKGKKHAKKKYAKKISLAPLSFEQAVGRLLQVKHKKIKSWKELLNGK